MKTPRLQWQTESTLTRDGYTAEVSSKHGSVTWRVTGPDGPTCLLQQAPTVEAAQVLAEDRIVAAAKSALRFLLSEFED